MAFTSKKPPLNVTIVDPPNYIDKWGVLPVSNHAIYEPSSSKFHPDGFFSEVIFGQIGSSTRLVKKGYIDLRTNIITPHLYNQLVKLKGFYKDILAGSQYAYFDPQLKDFVKTTSDDPEGGTGYTFFADHLKEINFLESGSSIRHMRIELFKKYADRIFMRQLLVIPAGMRDIRESNGKTSSEEINKLYFAVLSLTQALPESDTGLGDSRIFDGIRYQIQNKVQEIYNYLADLMDGKGGFAQSKYASRAIVYAGRNVITASPLTRVPSPDSPQMFSIDEVEVPLYQALKEAQPLIVNKLNKLFFENIFDSQSSQVALIENDTEENALLFCQVDQKEMKRFTTAEGIGDLINEFRDPHDQMRPVTVNVKDARRPAFLYMVYDTGTDIYTFRDKEDFKRQYSREDRYSLDNLTNLDYVKEYDPNEFIILGSSALCVYGMEHYNQDLDIYASKTLFETIKKSGEFTRLDNGCWRCDKDGKHVDVYNEILDRSDGDSFENEKAIAYHIGQYHIFNRRNLLALYTWSNRPKDKYKIDFLESIVVDYSKIRPLTYAEMMYMAAYAALKNRHATATRQPVLNLEGIQLYKIHVVSTQPNRIVHLRKAGSDDPGIILPNYPKMNEPIKMSLSVHPATLDAYGGDHDGDTMSLIILLSDEANKNVESYLNSKISMVGANGGLVYPLSTKINKYQFYAATYHPLTAEK